MSLKDSIDIVAGFVTTLAAILAGTFAYYRFVKGRVFHARLTVTAQAHQLRVATTAYVVAALEVSNVGLSAARRPGRDASLVLGCAPGCRDRERSAAGVAGAAVRAAITQYKMELNRDPQFGGAGEIGG